MQLVTTICTSSYIPVLKPFSGRAKRRNILDFTHRILSQCSYLFTIRLPEAPEVIIGDCALHHHNLATGEIEIGGALLPAFQGKGLMKIAFEELLQRAKKEIGVKVVLARTGAENQRAIGLGEKLGFERVGSDGRTGVVLRKRL